MLKKFQLHRTFQKRSSSLLCNHMSLSQVVYLKVLYLRNLQAGKWRPLASKFHFQHHQMQLCCRHYPIHRFSTLPQFFYCILDGHIFSFLGQVFLAHIFVCSFWINMIYFIITTLSSFSSSNFFLVCLLVFLYSLKVTLTDYFCFFFLFNSSFLSSTSLFVPRVTNLTPPLQTLILSPLNCLQRNDMTPASVTFSITPLISTSFVGLLRPRPTRVNTSQVATASRLNHEQPITSPFRQSSSVVLSVKVLFCVSGITMFGCEINYLQYYLLAMRIDILTSTC